MNTYAQQLQNDVDADGFCFNVSTDEVYKTDGEGYWSNVAKNVRVTDMGMYVSTQADEDERCDGDFYVLYDEATWNNSVDGLIYTDKTFIAYVREKMYDVLYAMGCDEEFAHELVADISYSEQGMQDDGRVSCDAYMLADYLRSYYAKETA